MSRLAVLAALSLATLPAAPLAAQDLADICRHHRSFTVG